MGASGFFLRDNGKLELKKVIEDTRGILDKIGYYGYYWDTDHTISVQESQNWEYSTRGFVVGLHGKSNWIVHEFYGYGGTMDFDEIKEGVVWAAAIVIEDFSEREDMLLRFAHEYLKRFPQDIFYDELTWYYTKEDIDNILSLPYDEDWCYKNPKVYEEAARMFTRHVNKAGTEVKIFTQSRESINNAIAQHLKGKHLECSNSGESLKATVADFINKDTDAVVVEYLNRIKDGNGGPLGDIDVSTSKQLIEVKESMSSVNLEQLAKYTDDLHERFFNFDYKEVVLYLNKPIDMNVPENIKKLNQIKKLKMEVTIVVGLEELRKVVK